MSKPLDIAPIKDVHYDSVIEFLRENFFPEEPCAKAIDLCPLGYRIPALEKQIRGILNKNLSLGAFVPGSNDLAGVIVIDLKVNGDWDKLERSECQCQDFPAKFKKLDRFFSDLCTAYGKRDSLRAMGINEAYEVFIIATSPEYQGQGVASALFEEVIRLAQDNGTGGVTCMALSHYTQKICNKLGFKEQFRIPYSDYEQDGVPLFVGSDMGQHQNGVFYGLKL